MSGLLARLARLEAQGGWPPCWDCERRRLHPHLPNYRQAAAPLCPAGGTAPPIPTCATCGALLGLPIIADPRWGERPPHRGGDDGPA